LIFGAGLRRFRRYLAAHAIPHRLGPEKTARTPQPVRLIFNVLVLAKFLASLD